MNYKLNDNAQLTIVALFQKGLVLMEDCSSLVEQLRFKFDDFGELECINPEICEITQEEIDAAMAVFENEKVEA